MAGDGRTVTVGGGMGAMVRSPEAVDRTLLGACAVIWLAVLGVSVAAAVVLADLGTASAAADTGADTPWLLYVVIGVSALVIIGSIPLLLRARNSTTAESRKPAQRVVAASGGDGHDEEPATEKLQAIEAQAPRVRTRSAAAVLAGTPPSGASAEVVDRIVLRCTVMIVSALGLSLVVVAAATYLMGVEKDTAAWIALGLAGLITAATPVIPWRYLGQLRAITDRLVTAD